MFVVTSIAPLSVPPSPRGGPQLFITEIKLYEQISTTFFLTLLLNWSHFLSQPQTPDLLLMHLVFFHAQLGQGVGTESFLFFALTSVE